MLVISSDDGSCHCELSEAISCVKIDCFVVPPRKDTVTYNMSFLLQNFHHEENFSHLRYALLILDTNLEFAATNNVESQTPIAALRSQ